MNIKQLIFYTLLAGLVWTAGCAGPTRHPDPLAGWKLCPSQDPKYLNKAIRADYQDYIQKLPSQERGFASYAHDFEDGTGRHAVTIIINLNGTEWTHALIYDREGKRVKVIKYISGHYRS